ncbi:MAG TPA: IMP dehydrogenase, partial [Ktedonobacteraceae bacterium]|nr:IMP dehydrogenase [Ktedonobacteraceae bacterium]
MSIQKRVRPGTGVSGLLESGLAFNYDSLTLVARVVSTLQHRAEAQPETRFGPFSLALPLIGSPMPDVCGAEMCRVLAQEGALGILHRFQSIDNQQREFAQVYSERGAESTGVGAAIGITGDYHARFEALYTVG